ncbi:LacI family DNA-binding transcriptional regulator [Breznakiella homolactica]|uniref:LacI family DNA-binding transcriptional regulator n=1 Tax=Breznakiella homolactica TaxID=2798577 RepID=A0A7T7XRH6_9SPIR|nr:LacI family DNA-binding transcriptional regulator [Breznakiella homolactica]QQO11094.1 LacI family transcriptional regulator [Breznakiella homolactica]
MPSHKNRKVTQMDVARYAEVSTGTVSRVVNNIPLVDGPTRTKVLRAIEELGYIPNHAAQALAQGRTKSLLLLILDKQPILPSTWQYELPVLQGINDYIKKHGYTLQIEITNYGQGETAEDVGDTILRGRSVDGLLILTSWEIDEEMLRKIHGYAIPAIFIGNGPYRCGGHPVGASVRFDNYSVIRETYRILYGLGHRRIAFIKGSTDQIHSSIRLSAFLDAAAESGTELPGPYLAEGHYSVQGGYQAMYGFARLTERPTAVICANDLMAIGAMKAAAELDIPVPRELSITGFDDIEISEYLSPPLTTVRVPAYDLGKNGASLLIRQIEQGTPPEDTLLPAAIVLRKSTDKNAG